MNSLDTTTEHIVGPTGLGGEKIKIDNLSRDVRKIHFRGKRPSEAERKEASKRKTTS
jgi:hypothetical protein